MYLAERINQDLVREVETTVDETIGACEEWTAHPIYRTTLRIVAIVSGSVFVGPNVCRNEQFIHDSSSSPSPLGCKSLGLMLSIKYTSRRTSWPRSTFFSHGQHGYVL